MASRLQQNLMKLGYWSLDFPGLPPSLLRILLDNAWGEIYFTPTPMPAGYLTKAALREVSLYTGVLWSVDQDLESEVIVAGGPSNTVWLGDESRNRGAVYEIKKSFEDSDIAAVVVPSLLDPTPLSIGSVQNPTAHPTGQYTGGHYMQTPKQALTELADSVGAEWRVNPDNSFDFGDITQLGYQATPIALVVPRLDSRGGWQPTTPRALPVAGMQSLLDVQDYTTRVLLAGEGAGFGTIILGKADTTDPIPYKHPDGTTLAWSQIISEPVLTVAIAELRAQVYADRYAVLRQAITLSLDDYVLGGDVHVGDWLYVYAPPLLHDNTNMVIFGGTHIQPTVARLFGIDNPVTAGMGVYFRDHSDNIYDLSDLYAPSTANPSLEVGDLARLAYDVSLGAHLDQSRFASERDDITVPNNPSDFALTPLTTYINRRGREQGHVNLSWTDPTQNTDGTDLVDFSHILVLFKRTDSEEWLTMIVEPGRQTVEVDHLQVQVEYQFKLHAADLYTNLSSGTDTLTNTPERDQIAPDKPPKPTVTPRQRALEVSLDLSTWGPLNPDTRAFRVWMGLKKSTATKIGRIVVNNADCYNGETVDKRFRIAKADVGKNHFCRVQAVDEAGNVSAYSDWGSTQPYDDTVPIPVEAYPRIRHFSFSKEETATVTHTITLPVPRKRTDIVNIVFITEEIDGVVLPNLKNWSGGGIGTWTDHYKIYWYISTTRVKPYVESVVINTAVACRSIALVMVARRCDTVATNLFADAYLSSIRCLPPCLPDEAYNVADLDGDCFYYGIVVVSMDDTRTVVHWPNKYTRQEVHDSCAGFASISAIFQRAIIGRQDRARRCRMSAVGDQKAYPVGFYYEGGLPNADDNLQVYNTMTEAWESKMGFGKMSADDENAFLLIDDAYWGPVTVGAEDSGGTGFRALRMPNEMPEEVLEPYSIGVSTEGMSNNGYAAVDRSTGEVTISSTYIGQMFLGRGSASDFHIAVHIPRVPIRRNRSIWYAYLALAPKFVTGYTERDINAHVYGIDKDNPRTCFAGLYTGWAGNWSDDEDHLTASSAPVTFLAAANPQPYVDKCYFAANLRYAVQTPISRENWRAGRWLGFHVNYDGDLDGDPDYVYLHAFKGISAYNWGLCAPYMGILAEDELFPYPLGRIENSSGGDSTNHTVELPPYEAGGNLVIVGVSVDGNTTTGWPSGWHKFFEKSQGSVTLALAWYKSTGSDPDSINVTTGASESFSSIAARLAGANDPDERPPEAHQDGVTGTDDKPEPPEYTASEGPNESLWLTFCALDGGGTNVTGFVAYPDDWDCIRWIRPSASSSGAMLGMAGKWSFAETVQPPAWTLESDRPYITTTVVVYPDMYLEMGVADLTATATLAAEPDPVETWAAANLSSPATLSATAAPLLITSGASLSTAGSTLSGTGIAIPLGASGLSSTGTITCDATVFTP